MEISFAATDIKLTKLHEAWTQHGPHHEVNNLFVISMFQEIASLAAKILRSTLAGSYLATDKRNAGTIDSLYNLPHLFAAGKR